VGVRIISSSPYEVVLTELVATVLIAHGSRRPEANADLVRLAGLLHPRLPEDRIEIAYLELAEPSIPTALQKCVDAGAATVRMLPFFLSAGAHVTEDLEEFRREFAGQHPSVRILLAPPIGLHPGIVDILVDRLAEAS